MKQFKKIYRLTSVFIITCFIIFTITSALSQEPNQGLRGIRWGMWRQLTEEQRTELRNLIKDLRDQDAGREAIRTAIQEKLDEWGIEKPERTGERCTFRRRGAFNYLLTDTQKEEIKEIIEKMKEEGAKPGEIREAVKDKMQEWGIELPDHKRHRHRHRNLFFRLTDEQKKELREMVQTMREQSATREEIQAAVDSLFNLWGIEFPERNHNPDKTKGLGKGQRKSGIRASNNPNPFNPETTINYTLENDEKVLLRIYNIEGQLIRTLADDYQSAGDHSVKWDGHSDNGETVPSGVYFYRIDAGQESLTQRMMLMK